jgi:general secretion pathway protein A
MYLEYFNLNRLPFENSPDPEFFFMGYRYREILALMIHGVVSRKGLICISGPIGSGKTTLATVLIGYLPPDAIVINMAHPKAGPSEMLTYLACQLDVAEYPETPLLQTEAIRQELIKLDNADRHCVLIIDESQYMSDALMQEIVVLTNLETPRRKLIQILMLGQKEFISKLNRPELRQLKHRIFVTRALTAMDTDQSFQYIRHRLQVADGDSAIFSLDALELIYKYSGGIPRLINRLCDAALLGAFTTQKKSVEEEDVRNANIDLGMELDDARASDYRQTLRRPAMHRPTMSADAPTAVEPALKMQAVPSLPVKSTDSDGPLKNGLIQKTAAAAAPFVADRPSDKMPPVRNRKMAPASVHPERKNPRLKLFLFLFAALAVAIILNLRGKNLKSALINAIKPDNPEANAKPTSSLKFSPVPQLNPKASPHKDINKESDDIQTNLSAEKLPAKERIKFFPTPHSVPQSIEPDKTVDYLKAELQRAHLSGISTKAKTTHNPVNAKPDIMYPYSVFLDTLATYPKAVIALAQFKKKGVSPYWVAVKQEEGNVRFNIFSGYFESVEQAALAIQKRHTNGVDSAIVMQTPYAALIGVYSSSETLNARQQLLEQAGYAPYCIPVKHPDRTQLYVGAFYTFQDAENKCSELIDSGIRCEPVER